MGKHGYSLRASSDYTAFNFTSSGGKNDIEKRIEYVNTSNSFDGNPVFNLAFGDLDGSNEIDDSIESNNGDIIRVMTTVMASIYEFTSQYPDCWGYFKGSNKQRNDFYQTILRRKQQELLRDFDLYGITESEHVDTVSSFELREEYDAFFNKTESELGQTQEEVEANKPIIVR